MEKKETSVGAVVINPQNKILLIFQRKAQYWEFPKGHMEGQEDELVTMDREVEEETGIKNYELIKDFRQEINYVFERDGNTVQKKVIFYLVRTNDPIQICLEHEQFKWADYEKALELVKHEEQKEVLKKVNDFLKNFSK